MPKTDLLQGTLDLLVLRARSILSAAMPSVPPALNDWERFPRSRRRVTAALVPGPGGEEARKAAAVSPAAPGPAAVLSSGPGPPRRRSAGAANNRPCRGN